MESDNKNGKQYGSSEPLKPAEPPAELLLPDIYAENDWAPKLMLEDQASAIDEAEGFNPYDTAILQKS